MDFSINHCDLALFHIAIENYLTLPRSMGPRSNFLVKHTPLFTEIIRDQVVEFLEGNKLIRDSQHGFRKGSSCLTNTLLFLDKVLHSVCLLYTLTLPTKRIV